MSGPERPLPHPADELALLAGALGAHARRQRARGRRRAWIAARDEGRPTLEAARADPALGTDERGARAPSDAPPGTPDPVAELRARAAECADLEALRCAVADCTACGLAATRKQTVFSDGDGKARVMFVGEAPGADEDRQGVPFVGRAGQLLTRIITGGMGLSREDVYICNVLKCRPPENRDPTAEEKRLCTGWLDRQIELVDPEVIIPLGRHAACHVLRTDSSMGRLRGRLHPFGRRKVVPTYHPAYLLRSPNMKKECWKDIQLAMGELGLALPDAPGGAGPSG